MDKLRGATGSLFPQTASVVAFDRWEASSAHARRRWNKKVHQLVLSGPNLADEGIPIRREGEHFRIDGEIHERHVLNLRMPTRRQVSAGGVVRHGTPSSSVLLLIQFDRKGALRWEIPKGKIRRRETCRRAAIREVREETGITVPLLLRDRIGRVDYTFPCGDGRLVFKTVHYYLIEAEREGAVEPRTEEGIRDVRWFSAENAREIVSFPNLRPILRRAAEAPVGDDGKRASP
ncbi:MAG: NUDIX domain-containing protein [Candidatus Eisenbacteria bacterium]|nr:NUDIX domain-containing protein [Candidatus Eisenbacteria bacterium]